MERVKGLKPSASAMARQRSNQLSYTRRANSRKIVANSHSNAMAFFMELTVWAE